MEGLVPDEGSCLLVVHSWEEREDAGWTENEGSWSEGVEKPRLGKGSLLMEDTEDPSVVRNDEFKFNGDGEFSLEVGRCTRLEDGWRG